MPPWERYSPQQFTEPPAGPWAKYGGETAASPAQDDVYHQAARADLEEARKSGAPMPGVSRRILQGATFNLADEALAGALTPLEMIKRGTINPAEGYQYAKARQDLEVEEARKHGGILGTAAEIGGGALTGAGLAKGGLTVAGRLAADAGLLPRSMASAADAAGYGAVAGAGEGNTLSERASNAGLGAAVGGLVGGVAPTAIGLASTVAAPIVSNIAARADPTKYARTQIARALTEGNRTPAEIARDLERAGLEGQDVYTVADAMGNPGQRLLSSVARAPGKGRTDVVEALESRQAGQGRRVASTLSEGFEAPQTAAQTEAALKQARRTEADKNYGAARGEAGSVNVSPVIEKIDETLQPGVTKLANPQTAIADDSVEGVLRRARALLTDNRSQISRFDEAHRAKIEIDNLIEKGSSTQQRVLIPVRNALDDELALTSKSYSAARDRFREQSKEIEAVAKGREAATRGRTEDTIPAFQRMLPGEQVAARAGYVDPLIAQTQGAAVGANKARPFTSDAFRAEAEAMAPGNAEMQRRLAREMQMFETRRQATGGSQTAENLADEAALGVDPTMVGNLLSGNWAGAARSGLAAGQRALTGNTPAVREELARMLLTRGRGMDEQTFRILLDETQAKAAARKLLAQQLGRGVAAGIAVTPSAAGGRR